MGYCISEGDIPSLPAGEVNAEMRRGSFTLTGAEDDQYLELAFTDLDRLIVLAEFIKAKIQTLGSTPNRYAGEKE